MLVLRKTQQRQKVNAFCCLKCVSLYIKELRELQEEFEALASPLLSGCELVQPK
jgi:hypothetical protein